MSLRDFDRQFYSEDYENNENGEVQEEEEVDQNPFCQRRPFNRIIERLNSNRNYILSQRDLFFEPCLDIEDLAFMYRPRQIFNALRSLVAHSSAFTEPEREPTGLTSSNSTTPGEEASASRSGFAAPERAPPVTTNSVSVTIEEETSLLNPSAQAAPEVQPSVSNCVGSSAPGGEHSRSNPFSAIHDEGSFERNPSGRSTPERELPRFGPSVSATQADQSFATNPSCPAAPEGPSSSNPHSFVAAEEGSVSSNSRGCATREGGSPFSNTADPATPAGETSGSTAPEHQTPVSTSNNLGIAVPEESALVSSSLGHSIAEEVPLVCHPCAVATPDRPSVSNLSGLAVTDGELSLVNPLGLATDADGNFLLNCTGSVTPEEVPSGSITPEENSILLLSDEDNLITNPSGSVTSIEERPLLANICVTRSRYLHLLTGHPSIVELRYLWTAQRRQEVQLPITVYYRCLVVDILVYVVQRYGHMEYLDEFQFWVQGRGPLDDFGAIIGNITFLIEALDVGQRMEEEDRMRSPNCSVHSVIIQLAVAEYLHDVTCLFLWWFDARYRMQVSLQAERQRMLMRDAERNLRFSSRGRGSRGRSQSGP